MGVGHDLKFDVVRVFDEFFDIDRAVAKSFFGFHAGSVKTLDEAHFVVGHAHSTSAATGDGFDHDWETDAAHDFAGVFLGLDDAIAPWGNGHTGLDGVGAGTIFVSHGPDGGGFGADEFNVTALADFGEVRIFGQKTVAGMDGIDIGNLGGTDDAIDFKITLGAGRGADADGFVGQLHVERIDVGLGIDRDGLHTEFATGAHDAECDFSPVGDQDFSKHSG